jgi:hypothetical protein
LLSRAALASSLTLLRRAAVGPCGAFGQLALTKKLVQLLLLLAGMMNGSGPEFFHLAWSTGAFHGRYTPIGDDLEHLAFADRIPSPLRPRVPGVDAMPCGRITGRVMSHAEGEVGTSDTRFGSPECRVPTNTAEQGEAFGFPLFRGCVYR